MAFESNFALWPILPFGAEENQENNQENNSGDQGGNTTGGQQNSNQQQQNNQQQNNDDDDDPYAGMSAKELRRLLADAENSKTATASELQAIKDAQAAEARKKNDDVTNLKTDLQTAKDENATLRAAMNKLAIKEAIREDKRFEWKNLDILAQQLNSEIVKVTDDGKVEGLPKELARIAKDENLSFLLAKDNTKQNQEQNQNQNQQQNQQQQQNNNGFTGFQPGQGGANGGGNLPPNFEQLVENTPALRSRM